MLCMDTLLTWEAWCVHGWDVRPRTPQPLHLSFQGDRHADRLPGEDARAAGGGVAQQGMRHLKWEERQGRRPSLRAE